jgi:small GTP-binding protein
MKVAKFWKGCTPKKAKIQQRGYGKVLPALFPVTPGPYQRNYYTSANHEGLQGVNDCRKCLFMVGLQTVGPLTFKTKTRHKGQRLIEDQFSSDSEGIPNPFKSKGQRFGFVTIALGRIGFFSKLDRLQMGMDSSFGFKVVFVGNSGVGKSAIVQSFCKHQFPEPHNKTLASSFHECSIEIPDYSEPVDLMIWDTPGRESLHPLAADAFPGADICAVVYNFSDRASFEAVPQWVERVKAVAPGVQVVLIENQVDLLSQGALQLEEGQRMATQLEAPLFRASAREGLNIRNLFIYLATTLQGKFLKSLSSLPVGADVFFMANGEETVQEGTAGAEEAVIASGAYCEVA